MDYWHPNMNKYWSGITKGITCCACISLSILHNTINSLEQCVVTFQQHLRGQTILIISIYLITLWTTRLWQLKCNSMENLNIHYDRRVTENFNAHRFSDFPVNTHSSCSAVSLWNRKIPLKSDCKYPNIDCHSICYSLENFIRWIEIEFDSWRLFTFFWNALHSNSLSAFISQKNKYFALEINRCQFYLKSHQSSILK